MAVQLNPLTTPETATSSLRDAQPKVASSQSTSQSTSAAAAPAAQTSADTLKLSLTGKIHLLRSQGQSAGQIAQSLGTDLKSIDSLLNIQPAPAASSTPTPTPAASSTPPPTPTSAAPPK